MLFALSFWRATWLALVRTFLAASVPFIPALVSTPASIWRLWVLTAGLAVVLSIVTALAGLPSSANGASWWEVALQRAARQFGQFIVAGLAGAAILTDVQWKPLILAALASAVSTLVLAALDLIPSTVVLDAVSTFPPTVSIPGAQVSYTGNPGTSTTGSIGTVTPVSQLPVTAPADDDPPKHVA